MEIALYPGCSLKGSAREYNESLVALSEALGIQLKEVSDWNCCGATAAHNLNHDLSLALPARILATAEKEGRSEVLVPCAACYSRLSTTRHELLENKDLREKISGLIEMQYQGTTHVLNILEFIEKYVVKELDGKVVEPCDHKVACYYGCLLVRPPKILKFDRPEDPQSMDNIMKKIGAAPIDWAFKVECCGAGFAVSRPDIVAKLSSKILDDAVSRGAEAMVVACPMCQFNLDMKRQDIEKYAGKKYDIPVLYITQAIGMALGIPAKKLGIHRHRIKVQWPKKAPAPETKDAQTKETEKE